jgi:hypothetical protein
VSSHRLASRPAVTAASIHGRRVPIGWDVNTPTDTITESLSVRPLLTVDATTAVVPGATPVTMPAPSTMTTCGFRDVKEMPAFAMATPAASVTTVRSVTLIPTPIANTFPGRPTIAIDAGPLDAVEEPQVARRAAVNIVTQTLSERRMRWPGPGRGGVRWFIVERLLVALSGGEQYVHLASQCARR